MSEGRLGDPVELPWWVVPLAFPPLAVAAVAIFLAAPWWAHAVAIGASVATLLVLRSIAVRVASPSMQSVWISVLYAFWVFVVVVWGVVVATNGSQSL